MIISALFSLHVLKSNFFQTKEKQKDFKRRAAEPLFFWMSTSVHYTPRHVSYCLLPQNTRNYHVEYIPSHKIDSRCGNRIDLFKQLLQIGAITKIWTENSVKGKFSHGALSLKESYLEGLEGLRKQ